ncbi:MAG: hypothetical protein ABIY48_11710 [Acidimicrobiales bacterium]
MGTLFGFAVGYLLGTKAGSEGYDELLRSAKAILDSEEFKSFLAVLREHGQQGLRQLSEWVGGEGESLGLEDLLREARARIQR